MNEREMRRNKADQLGDQLFEEFQNFMWTKKNEQNKQDGKYYDDQDGKFNPQRFEEKIRQLKNEVIDQNLILSSKISKEEK